MAATRGDLAQNNWDDFGVAITSVNLAKTNKLGGCLWGKCPKPGGIVARGAIAESRKLGRCPR